MGKNNLCLPSLFFFKLNQTSSQTHSSSSSSSSWTWPSCHHPKTHSFHATPSDNIIYKSTLNSAYFHSPQSHLTFTEEEQHETDSFSTTSVSGEFAGEGYTSENALIRRLKSDRLFFDAKAESSSSIMEEYVASWVPFKKSIVMAMESEDPCGDFKISMEEMVAEHGIEDWDCLLQLLVWYLKANVKETHGFIFGAFLDLVADIAAASSSFELLEGLGKTISN